MRCSRAPLDECLDRTKCNNLLCCLLQVATDTRLWLYSELKEIRVSLQELISVAAERADNEADILMPGFTHLQSAMTVRWSHWLLCHAASWQRDDQRLADLMPRVGTLPLGSGALAGNPFGVDRQFLSHELGFEGRVCPNSMDAVSDRDFVAETLFFAALHMVHLSRWAEDLIIYSSQQFGFVQCSDAYATGSSLMPQKKNPDALELIRGRARDATSPSILYSEWHVLPELSISFRSCSQSAVVEHIIDRFCRFGGNAAFQARRDG